MKKIIVILLFLLFVIVGTVYADDIIVTASVSPRPSDFQLVISSVPPSSTTVNQNQVITYTITYGSSLMYGSPMTLKASWTQGTIQGQGSPSVDIADYVLNSASNAYGNTSPVVDLTNRTITWTIASFPANTTNQTVTFQLKTNASYTGANTVTFTTTAHMDDSNITISDQSTNTTYQFNSGITPTPTLTPTNTPTTTPTNSPTSTQPTSSVTTTPTPTPTVSPSPAQTIQNLQFKTITIKSISANTATVHVVMNKKARLTFSYGISLHNLNKILTVADFTTTHDISLENLLPETTYYFRIIATGTDQQKATSDYFSFKTARISNIPTIDKNTLIITSENIILFDALLNKDDVLHDSIVIPTNTIYSFQFALKDAENIKKIQGNFLNKYVLGINTFTSTLPNINNVNILEIKPGVYTGRLLSPQTTGIYELSITTYDNNGNLSPQKIVDVWIDKPVQIFSKKTNQPIEKAKVHLFMFDDVEKTYKPISPQTLAIQNPLYTDANGTLPTVLPQGKYKATITSLFYKPQTITFSIGPNQENAYPQLYLVSDGFSLSTFIQYYGDTTNDFLHATKEYLRDLSISHRFFDLIAALVLSCLILLTSISLSLRTNISLFSFPWLVVYSIKHLLFFKKYEHTISGKIIDEQTGKSVKNALIYIINADTNSIIDKVFSDIFGEFYSPMDHCVNFKLSVRKKGYDTHEFFEYSSESLQMGKIILEIKKSSEKDTVLDHFIKGLANIIYYLFELLLLLTFLLELLFGYILGWSRALPFVLLTLFNLTLWILHVWRAKK